MNDFDLLLNEVNDGMLGRNAGIPMGFSRLNDYISIRKSNNYLIGGYTGSGKTAILDDAFVLNPIDWYVKEGHRSSLKLSIIYWSMERRKNFKYAKWISRKIFLDHGIIISVSRLMGWSGTKLTKDEHDLFLMYRDYLDAILSVVIMKDYPENPTGIRNYIRDYSEQRGKIEEVDEFHKVYIANNPNLITLNIKDHVGLYRKEKNLLGKKEVIDKASEDDRFSRDFYGISNVNVSQFNRDIANPMRIKNGDVEPMLEDFKDTGSTQEDADIVLSLFDPMRYKVPDPTGYDLSKLRDKNGRKKYRSLKILKNSYGSDDVRIGLAFQPEIGMFKEMPRLFDTTEETYDSIIDNTYFLEKWNKQ
jgi:hypothetical protein